MADPQVWTFGFMYGLGIGGIVVVLAARSKGR